MTLNFGDSQKYLSSFTQPTTPSQLSPSSILSINISACDNTTDNKDSANVRHFLSPTCAKLPKRVFFFIVRYALTYPLIIFSIWALLYIFWGNLAFPDGGPLFALIALEISAIFLGYISSLIALPPHVGMLCAGLILRNVPGINVAKDLTLAISTPLRGIAIVILLTRGAVTVNFDNIRKFKTVVPPLAIGSCVIEAVIGGLSVFFLIGFSPSWCALMGCVMSAMSGAALMPYLLKIESSITINDSNIIVSKAKEVLIIAKTACGLDAILAICLAEISLGFVLGQEELKAGLVKGLAEVTLGGVFGVFWGGLSGILLLHESNADIKMVAVFSGGVMSLIGLYKIGYPRGGPLGVFVGTLIAVSIWRWKKVDLTNLTSAYDKLWFIFQPLLFGIIGSRTDFEIVDWVGIYRGVICLTISAIGRGIGSFLMTSWSGLPFRERLFLVVAWMGKGTVQAALGPVALDTILDLKLDNQEKAYQIMNLSTMIILFSSLFGFLALRICGHRLLNLR